MASRPELDDLARMLRDDWGAGTILGALPRSEKNCDIEIAMILPSGDRYVLRHVVMDLNALNDLVDLFGEELRERRPTFPHTDTVVRTVEEALAAADQLGENSAAVGIPDLPRWMALGGDFEHQLKGSRLRSRISWLPQPSLLVRVGRTLLSPVGVGAVALLFVGYVLETGDYIAGGYFDDTSPSESLTVAVSFIAAVAVLALLVNGVGAMRNRHARKHRKHWGAHDRRRPQSTDHQASHGQET